MRLLFIADGRSPIAQNWIRYFAERGDEVHLASTFACSVDFPLNGFEITPVAFSRVKKQTQRPGSASSQMLRPFDTPFGRRAALRSARALGLRTAIRHTLGPLTIPRASRRLRTIIQQIQPDLIHAMRIPYEGMLAADAYMRIPLIVSVWGNDFTLHAPSTALMRHYTIWTMKVADALHADCERDIRLGKEWGFNPTKPTLVAPGNGGIRMDIFYPPTKPVEEPVIINPRGFRAYVRNDNFFKAIPLVLDKHPDAKFMCASMAGESQAEQWIRGLNIGHAVELLAPMPHAQMADVFRGAQMIVSPSIHDGTPNSLLEGMACGCFPIAGDLESIREWITPHENGLLFDSTDHQSIANSIVQAIENKSLRQKATGLNTKLIARRAEYRQCMDQADKFYNDVIRKTY
jgi:glycosyltransferase involved in cell wall biosynthesis